MPDPPVSQTPRQRSEAAQEPERMNLLRQESVLMTVLAQDPVVVDETGGPMLARVSVPADRLQRGPRSHRFHVVDLSVGTNAAQAPVRLHRRGDPWTYVDPWLAAVAEHRGREGATWVADREFRAQNVFAVASHTLALFEQHLGRPIAWYSDFPQLYLVPAARVEMNAFYSREHNAVLFGWMPALGGRDAVYTALSYDVVAHEVTHAILDGLRPRFTEPALPDQLAFHEALADLVALFSVFGLDGVAQHLLDPSGSGRITFASDGSAQRQRGEDARRRARAAGRAAELKATPLAGLAEQLGAARSPRGLVRVAGPGRYPALRRAVDLPETSAWSSDPLFEEPHRRAEVLVAAFMLTFVSIWADRLEPLRTDQGGMDVVRVAEEGMKAADHLLAMLLRALDYLPPVELQFADVVDSVLTADLRLAPEDRHGYRDVLLDSFAAFGIVPSPRGIVDVDGVVAPARERTRKSDSQPAAVRASYPKDPDAPPSRLGLRYEHLNFAAMRTSPEEVYQFIWNNASWLQIDVRLATRVERVLASARVGPDGLIVNEILADYTQRLRTTAAHVPPGVTVPPGMPAETVVEMWGGGVLVFDQFGRFRLHQRKPLLDLARQSERLSFLWRRQITDGHGGVGTTDGAGDRRRFALLHQEGADQ